MNRILGLCTAVCLGAASHASFTIATFADPSQNKSQYMFLWDEVASTLTGNWSAPGLTLETPGLIGGGQTSNCLMNFDTVSLSPIIAGQLYLMSAGRIRFHTGNLADPVLEITFDSGLFQTPLAVGGSNLLGNNVKFHGQNVPNGLSEEQFSFGLTNEDQQAGKRTYTSSFTSSAVPEPVSILVLAGGLAALVRRRRRP